MINCSFGNGWRTTKVPKYKEVMIEAARSLATRFREKPGIIQSWDVTRGWQSERGWECPVIIDNMMNLELLLKQLNYLVIPPLSYSSEPCRPHFERAFPYKRKLLSCNRL